ncbi:hypothetical protein L596_027910 [Steinernema carpocapsae]|uniref:WH1 domain-containing protein n=1 Tax=Steinernema carpocapsae TaxID=34508 RepID=A0A4U5LWW9_STECR|nr:hypothetical protein L596_027910 [Steinernema carpocapsae]
MAHVDTAYRRGVGADSGRERRKKPKPANTGSNLLTDDENQRLYVLLGGDSVSLAAGVVQLLATDGDHSRWQAKNIGVVSLVKDYNRRVYVLKLFEIYKQTSPWEQILYKNFRVKTNSIHQELLTFEGDYCMYGLNFSSRDEAVNFKVHLDKRYEQEQKTSDIPCLHDNVSDKGVSVRFSCHLVKTDGGQLHDTKEEASRQEANNNFPTALAAMLFRRYYCYLPPQASLSSSEDEHFTSTSYALPKASLGSQRVHYYGRQERIYDNVFEDEFSRDVETSRLRTSGAMFPVTSPGCRYFHHPSFEAPKRVALSRSCSQSSGRSQPVYAQRHPEQVTHGSNGNAPIRRISMIYATPPTQKFAHSMPGRFPVSAQDYWHANANKQTQSYVQKAPS